MVENQYFSRNIWLLGWFKVMFSFDILPLWTCGNEVLIYSAMCMDQTFDGFYLSS